MVFHPVVEGRESSTKTSAGEGKAEAEDCNDNEAMGDNKIEKVKSGDVLRRHARRTLR